MGFNIGISLDSLPREICSVHAWILQQLAIGATPEISISLLAA